MSNVRFLVPFSAFSLAADLSPASRKYLALTTVLLHEPLFLELIIRDTNFQSVVPTALVKKLV